MQITLHVAAQVQQDPAPVGDTQQWHLDVLQVVLLARVVVVVTERVRLIVLGLVSPVGDQDLLGQVALDRVLLAPRAGAVGREGQLGAAGQPVLVDQDLPVPPEADKTVAQDATVPAAVAVVVGHALPRDDGGQALGAPRGDTPLRAGVVRNAKQADLAARPGLVGRPLDDVEEAFACAAAHGVEQARRLA